MQDITIFLFSVQDIRKSSVVISMLFRVFLRQSPYMESAADALKFIGQNIMPPYPAWFLLRIPHNIHQAIQTTAWQFLYNPPHSDLPGIYVPFLPEH